MHPKEKPIAWVGMFMLLKGTPRRHLSHAYVNAWSSKASGGGSRTTTATGTRTSSEAVVERAAQGPPAHEPESGDPAERLPRPRHPDRAEYAHLWEQVKAA
jgi:hypothetical protein